LHIFYSMNIIGGRESKPPVAVGKGVKTQSPYRLAIFGLILPKQCIFGHISANILPKILRNLFTITSLYLICSILAIYFAKIKNISN